MLLRRKDPKPSSGPSGSSSSSSSLLLTLDDAPLVLDPQRVPPRPSTETSMPAPVAEPASSSAARSSLPPPSLGRDRPTSGARRDLSPSLGGTRRSTTGLTAVEWSPAAALPPPPAPTHQRPSGSSVGQLLAARRNTLIVPAVLDYAGGLDGRARSSRGGSGAAVHGGHSAPRRSVSMAAPGGSTPGGVARGSSVTGGATMDGGAPSPKTPVAIARLHAAPLADADVGNFQAFLAAHPNARLIGRHPSLAPPFRVRNRFVSRVHVVIEHFAVDECITLRAVIRDRFQRMEGTFRDRPEITLGNPDTTLEDGLAHRRRKRRVSEFTAWETQCEERREAKRLGARPASKKWPPSSDDDNDESNLDEQDPDFQQDLWFATLLNRRLQAMLSLMVPLTAAAAAAADDDDGSHDEDEEEEWSEEEDRDYLGRDDSGAWSPRELVSNGRVTLLTNVGNGPVFIGNVRVIPGVPVPIRANDVIGLLEAAPAEGLKAVGQPAATFTATPHTPSPMRAIGRPQPVGGRRSRSHSAL